MALTNRTFNYTGSVQNYQTPNKHGIYRITCIGAAGSHGGSNGTNTSSGQGGKGGKVITHTYFSPSKHLFINVGQKGFATNQANERPWGLEQAGFSTVNTDNGICLGGSGSSVCVNGNTLNHRLIVAGGGGGATYDGVNHDNAKGTGGNGGTNIGGTASGGKANRQATGGNQTSGGVGGTVRTHGDVTPVTGGNGRFGFGGDSKCTYEPGGTGGGGWYGGGAGGGDNNYSSTDYSAAGGGGSNYILTKDSYKPEGYAVNFAEYYGFATEMNGTTNNYDNGQIIIEPKFLFSDVTASWDIHTKNVIYVFNGVEGSLQTTYNVKFRYYRDDTLVHETPSVVSTSGTIVKPTEEHFNKITLVVNEAIIIDIIIDTEAPTVNFTQEVFENTWESGVELTNVFQGTDKSDTDLDFEIEEYISGVKVGQTISTKSTNFTPSFVYNGGLGEGTTETYLKVRALQSADIVQGDGTDIWSNWVTSPTAHIQPLPLITYSQDFLNKVFYQGESVDITSVLTCADPNVSGYEVQHWINGSLDSTQTIEANGEIIPPLKYSVYNPSSFEYGYQIKVRAKNSSNQFTGWYESPITKAQYNIPPKDSSFITNFKKIYIVGEKFNIEWNAVTDPNNTRVLYDLTLCSNEGTPLATWSNLAETSKEVVIPEVSIQKDCYFSVVAHSDRLFSNLVSSKPFNITDVNITDCNLIFPNLTTNLVIEKVNEIAIVINGDTRLIKTTNLSNYVLPLHYFRSGKNTLTLKVKDKINTVIERTWNVNLTLDKANLVSSEQPTVTGYFAFNYDNAEHFNKAVELQKSNIDLGVVEHTFLGSTPFEGSNTVTQKLEITRKANDDTTQLRTIKITGAIE